MKTENYPKNNGTNGSRYILEKGDVIEAMFSTPRETMLGKSKYPSYSIKAKWNDKEIFVSLTHGQYKRLMGMDALEDKKLVTVGYPGPEGKELVGLEVLD
jgi:hypothetical protein